VTVISAVPSKFVPLIALGVARRVADPAFPEQSPVRVPTKLAAVTVPAFHVPVVTVPNRVILSCTAVGRVCARLGTFEPSVTKTELAAAAMRATVVAEAALKRSLVAWLVASLTVVVLDTSRELVIAIVPSVRVPVMVSPVLSKALAIMAEKFELTSAASAVVAFVKV
jgi:hypothetical protein